MIIGRAPYTRAARQRLYRALALILARIPRGDDTVLRIVWQRSGSQEDYMIALTAMAQAKVELREEKKKLKASFKDPNHRKRK